jgi:tetratricopeptide (TPR) repeat protein
MKPGAVAAALLLILAAAPPVEPLELVRQGNEAFERGEFAAALGLYELAEERITDPGLVAFNKAAALYRLGRFVEAERHYRRTLEGATGRRRAQAWYDLGNALLMQDRGDNADALRAAIDCYEQCLRAGADSDLADSARHNLQLAKLLWLKARPAAPQKKEDAPDRHKSGDGPSKDEPQKKQVEVGMTPGTPEVGPNDKPKAEVLKPQPGQKPIETPQATAGKGNLPLVEDTDKVVPLAPEDALAHLQRATERILRERQAHQLRTAATPSRTVKDW